MKEIDLGDLEFVSFVTHTQMADKKLFNEDSCQYSNITFLARHHGKIRLLCYRCDPCLSENDQDDTEDSKHDCIFLFDGVLGDTQT